MADCGASALAMVLDYFGRRVPFDELRDATGTGRDGTNARVLVDAARLYGLEARGVRASAEQVRALPRGTLLFWNEGHFVVLDGGSKTTVHVVDPAVGKRKLTWQLFRESFSEVALLLEPGDDFRRARDRRPTIGRYIKPVLQQEGALRRTLLISLLLRLLLLSVPLFLAVLVDRIIPTGNRSLLTILSLCLGVIFVFHFLCGWLRSRLLVQLRTRVDRNMAVGFVEHLVRLPYVFHLRRSSGDMMMRLGTNSAVREILTSSAVTAMLDGSIAALYLLLLFFISPGLGLTVAGLGALQVVALLLAKDVTQRLATEGLQAQAKSEGFAFQLLAGMGTLKSAGAEHLAVERFASLFDRELEVSHQRGRLSAFVDSLLNSLAFASPLVVLVSAAVRVLDGEISLGTALAINALAAGFLTPLSALVTTALATTVLVGYIHRLDDVFETPPEQAGRAVRPAPRLQGAVSVEHASFRYSPLAPFVLEDVSLEIQPGQKVALVGASGSGKTTLGNLILGLYEPSSGCVRHDGIDQMELEARSVRAQVGVVVQDPYLFAGSINDNIAFMDPDMPSSRVQHAAAMACVADDVDAMPLGYSTHVGDGGSLVSGGQRQRIALARALAREPRILLLDEATSHLDAVTEAAVYQRLAELSATIVIVAHRLSTIAWADVIVVVDGGRILESGSHHELCRSGGYYSRLVELQQRGAPRPT